MGLVPAGAYNNRKFRIHMVDAGPGVDPVLIDVFFDPQTSGGLLISVPESHARSLVASLKDAGIAEAAVVGEVTGGPDERILLE
jgi:selenide,water dikinase